MRPGTELRSRGRCSGFSHVRVLLHLLIPVVRLPVMLMATRANDREAVCAGTQACRPLLPPQFPLPLALGLRTGFSLLCF